MITSGLTSASTTISSPPLLAYEWLSIYIFRYWPFSTIIRPFYFEPTSVFVGKSYTSLELEPHSGAITRARIHYDYDSLSPLSTLVASAFHVSGAYAFLFPVAVLILLVAYELVDTFL